MIENFPFLFLVFGALAILFSQYPLQCASSRLVSNERLGSIRLLLGLEVVEQDGALLRLLTPVLDNDARAVDNLAGVALAVENACDMLAMLLHRSRGKNKKSASWLCILVDTRHDATSGVVNVQRPAHSPSCLPSGTLIRGILCSEHRAMTSFL